MALQICHSGAMTNSEIREKLLKADRKFAPVVEAIGDPPSFRAKPSDQRFGALVSSVTSQLLSTKAAATIHGRLVEAVGGNVTPAAMLQVELTQLRSAGLSNAKARTMIDLAQRVHGGHLRLDAHARLDDDTVTRELVTINGVGPWTAHMYLLFTLGRKDIWPTGDMGVRNGWTIIHRLEDRVSPMELEAVGRKFEGYRSTVAWYCWQAVHLDRGDL